MSYTKLFLTNGAATTTGTERPRIAKYGCISTSFVISINWITWLSACKYYLAGAVLKYAN